MKAAQIIRPRNIPKTPTTISPTFDRTSPACCTRPSLPAAWVALAAAPCISVQCNTAPIATRHSTMSVTCTVVLMVLSTWAGSLEVSLLLFPLCLVGSGRSFGTSNGLALPKGAPLWQPNAPHSRPRRMQAQQKSARQFRHLMWFCGRQQRQVRQYLLQIPHQI